MLLNSLDDAKFKRQNQMIGKVVFLKDRDIEMNPLEKEMSSWVTQFHFKMHQLCTKKPRYSEMRPTKYNL
jgi:GTP-binding protein EngB required for normal cell division